MTAIKQLKIKPFKAFTIPKIPRFKIGPIVATTMQRWVWNTHSDDRTCDDCDSLDGQTFEVEDVSDFQTVLPYGQADGSDLFHPNVHPHCRCEIVLLETYWVE